MANWSHDGWNVMMIFLWKTLKHQAIAMRSKFTMQFNFNSHWDRHIFWFCYWKITHFKTVDELLEFFFLVDRILCAMCIQNSLCHRPCNVLIRNPFKENFFGMTWSHLSLEMNFWNKLRWSTIVYCQSTHAMDKRT